MNDNDCVSRKAVIDLAMQYCPDDDGSCSKADVDLREMLDELEALHPVPHEMTARELYSAYQRICKEYNPKRKPVRCYECPLYVDCPRIGEALRMVMVCSPHIEKWAREHPERSAE